MSQNPPVIQFNCTACGTLLTVPIQMAGVTGPCPQCGNTVTSPRGPTPQPPPAGPIAQVEDFPDSLQIPSAPHPLEGPPPMAGRSHLAMGGLPDPRLAAFPPAPPANGPQAPVYAAKAEQRPPAAGPFPEAPLPPGVLAGQGYHSPENPDAHLVPLWMQQGPPATNRGMGPQQPADPAFPAAPPAPVVDPHALPPSPGPTPLNGPNVAGSQWPPNGVLHTSPEAHPVLSSLLKTPVGAFTPTPNRDPLGGLGAGASGPAPAANPAPAAAGGPAKAPPTTFASAATTARSLRSQQGKPRESRVRFMIASLVLVLAALGGVGWMFRDTIRSYVQDYRFRHSHPETPEVALPRQPKAPASAPVSPPGDNASSPAKNANPKFNPAAKSPSADSASSSNTPSTSNTASPETIQRATPAPNPPAPSAIQEIENKKLPPQITVHAKDEAAPAVDVLKKFFAAPTWHDRVAYVQLGDQLKGLMEHYYSQTKDGPIEIENIELLPGVPSDDPQHAQFVFVVSGKSLKQPLPVMVQNTPNGFKVDWLTFTEFKDELLLKFAENYQEGSARFHVAIHRCHYLDNDVPDLDKKICFEASPPMPGFTVHAFVDKKSALAKELEHSLGWNVLDAKVIAELHWRKQDNFQWLEIVAIPQFSWQNAMPVSLPPKAGTATKSGGR